MTRAPGQLRSVIASNTSSAMYENSYVINPGQKDIDVDDSLETLSLVDYLDADDGGTDVTSGHVKANTACSTSCETVGYSPTPVGVDGRMYTPPVP